MERPARGEDEGRSPQESRQRTLPIPGEEEREHQGQGAAQVEAHVVGRAVDAAQATEAPLGGDEIPQQEVLHQSHPGDEHRATHVEIDDAAAVPFPQGEAHQRHEEERRLQEYQAQLAEGLTGVSSAQGGKQGDAQEGRQRQQRRDAGRSRASLPALRQPPHAKAAERGQQHQLRQREGAPEEGDGVQIKGGGGDGERQPQHRMQEEERAEQRPADEGEQEPGGEVKQACR